MNVEGLPRWAKPFNNESKNSWLDATRQCLSVEDCDWAVWVRASVREPEYPADTMDEWHGLPKQLGEISEIAPCWRLGPTQRHVYCEKCYVGHGDQRRWPTCIDWLDARELRCSRHDRLLVYLTPHVDAPLTAEARVLIPEVALLCGWLSEWRDMDRRAGRGRVRESQWRRDLVTLAMRNWSVVLGVGAYAMPAWELQLAGWNLPGRIMNVPPGLPARVGHLSPLSRIGALLAAFRYWNRLEGRSRRVDPLTATNGWTWFSRRWCDRAGVARRRRLVDVREATEQAQYARLTLGAKASRHRRPH